MSRIRSWIVRLPSLVVLQHYVPLTVAGRSSRAFGGTPHRNGWEEGPDGVTPSEYTTTSRVGLNRHQEGSTISGRFWHDHV